MPSITLRGNFTDLTSWDGQFIFNEGPQIDDDPSDHSAMPSPLTWTTGFAPYWSFFSCACDNWPGGPPLTERSNYNGASLITPIHCVVANHSPPQSDADGNGTVFFLQADGTEISREIVNRQNIEGDLTVITLDSAITTIDPVAIAIDSSQFGNCQVAVLEKDRHINAMRVARGGSDEHFSAELPQGQPLSNDRSLALAWRPNSDDALEGGDSGKPIVAVFAGTPILLCALFNAATANSVEQYGYGPNLSHYISELSTLVEADGEELTLATLLPTGNYDRPVLPSAAPAVFSTNQYHPVLIGT